MSGQTLDIYVRVSRTNGRDGESFISSDVQQEACRALALARGITVGKVLTDLDKSGGKMDRPALTEAIERVKSSASAGLIVARLDRFARTLLGGLQTLQEIEQADGVVISADGLLDTASPTGKLVTGVLLALGEFELDRYRRNWADASEHAVAAGKYQGVTPVGFTRMDDGTLVQNADAPTVRQVFLDRASGRSWHRLADDLEAAGVRTANGSERWHINSVRSLIGNKIYKGTLANGIEHHFPRYAIVTPSEWEAAQSLKGQGARRDRGRWAILGGLVWCSACGGRLTPTQTTRDGKEYPYYQCRNRSCTEHARAAARELEPLVVESAVSTFEEIVASGAVTTGHEPDVEKQTALSQALDKAKARERAALLRLNPDDADDAEVLASLAAEVEGAKAALTDEIGSTQATVTPEQWRASWDAWSVEEKREALGRIVDRVVVSRVGRRYADGSDTDAILDGTAETEPSKLLLDRVEIEYRY